MNQFELFSMIFYALDSVWEDTKDFELGQFLSSANPFLFLDIGSADPAIYADFITKVPKKIDVEDSYKIALDYMKSLNNERFLNAFTEISQDEWEEEVKEYLAEPHKC